LACCKLLLGLIGVGATAELWSRWLLLSIVPSFLPFVVFSFSLLLIHPLLLKNKLLLLLGWGNIDGAQRNE
jgi:hypothetical protein